ncbi:MAG: hypothetical protein ABFD82_11965 [Syntrophaceae bacterium]
MKASQSSIKQIINPVDVLAVDANIYFYMDRTLLQRMDGDVMPEFRADKYSAIRLIGTSMGILRIPPTGRVKIEYTLP